MQRESTGRARIWLMIAGVATLVPAAMHGGDELPGLRAGTGLTVVSRLMRLGFLVSPPVVGLVADAVGLCAGLLVVPLAGSLVSVLAGVLSAARSEQMSELIPTESAPRTGTTSASQ